VIKYYPEKVKEKRQEPRIPLDMSFQYEQFQGAGPQDGNSAPTAPNPQDGTMTGQPSDQSQTPFQGAPGGQVAPGSGPQSGEKTTLW
jgi:hypothetical protein